MRTIQFLFVLTGLLMASIGSHGCSSSDKSRQAVYNSGSVSVSADTAIFASGCFWCTEAHFQRLKGVDTVISGYIGGRTSNPSYQLVSTGLSGHAEAILVVFDPKVISYTKLLEVFFATHDPTQLNRQGNDIGTQYRSAIFYRTPEQKAQSEKVMQLLTKSKIYPAPIVTTIDPYSVFYIAEPEHQNYFYKNREDAYCQYVIVPKLSKFREVFGELLKNER